MGNLLLILHIALVIAGWSFASFILNTVPKKYIKGEIVRISEQELYARSKWNLSSITGLMAINYLFILIGFILAYLGITFIQSIEIQLFLFPILFMVIASIPSSVWQAKWQMDIIHGGRTGPTLFDVGQVLQRRGRLRIYLASGLLGVSLLTTFIF